MFSSIFITSLRLFLLLMRNSRSLLLCRLMAFTPLFNKIFLEIQHNHKTVEAK